MVRRLAVVAAVALPAIVALFVINGRNDDHDVTRAPHHENQQTAVVSTGPGAAFEDRVQVVLQAPSLEHAARYYRDLFKAAGVAGLPTLKRHPHDGIALQAAWEEVLLTVPEKPKAGGVRPEKLEWFLGFLERRLGVQPPRGWAETLLNAHAYGRHTIKFRVPKKHRYRQAGLDLLLSPRGTTIKREGGKVVLTIGHQSATLPEGLFSEANGELSSHVSALVTPRRCYVAVDSSGMGLPYRLTCIDRASDKVIWKSWVWALWYGGTYQPGDSWFAVLEQDGRVVVFGASNWEIYVEAFRAADGSSLFRFSGGTDWGRLWDPGS